jgi:hypothetical protein
MIYPLHKSKRAGLIAWNNQMLFNVHPFSLSSKITTLTSPHLTHISRKNKKKNKNKHAVELHLPPLSQAKSHSTPETSRYQLALC